ncbi:MAG: hypothetical protein ACREB6_03510 [Rhodospirillales bacterium]
MAVDPASVAASNLTQVLAQLRRTLLQERVALQLVEQATEAQKAANAANVTVGRGKVLDIEA